jgi:adenylate cyclase, class 2
MADETEIKFRVKDVAALEAQLRKLGFSEKTPSTEEVNTLYDLPTGELRRKSEVLRIRRYGDFWKITHKTKGSNGRHKVRVESETEVSNGPQMDAILRALGYVPAFIYEKFRAEWTDGRGDVVVDRTPIGNLAEIEGSADWIDEIAGKLHVSHSDYITKSYSVLFVEWRSRTGSSANNMTFAECGKVEPKTLSDPNSRLL